MNERKEASLTPDQRKARQMPEHARQKQAREPGTVEYDSWAEAFRQGARHG